MSFLKSLETDLRAKSLALWGLALCVAALAAPQILTLVRFQPLGFDFLPMWTAGRMAWTRPDQIYDFAAVTDAQRWLLGGLKWVRPYAYPPTALLLFAPLGLMPFWAALGAWVIASLGVFLFAGQRVAQAQPRLRLVLTAFSPAVLTAVLVGQTVLVVAGLAMLAVTELGRRPRAAGVLLGLAAAIKPQMLLLAPVALLAGGLVETAIAAVVTALALAALSGALFGFDRWLAWLGSLGRFQMVVEQTPRLPWGVISPSAAAFWFPLAPAAIALLRGACAVLAAALVWALWSRPTSPERRIAALLAGGLLVTPYAMYYDASAIVPAAAAAAARLDQPGWIARFLALLAITEMTTPFVGSLCLVAYLILTFGWCSGWRPLSAAPAVAV